MDKNTARLKISRETFLAFQCYTRKEGWPGIRSHVTYVSRVVIVHGQAKCQPLSDQVLSSVKTCDLGRVLDHINHFPSLIQWRVAVKADPLKDSRDTINACTNSTFRRTLDLPMDLRMWAACHGNSKTSLSNPVLFSNLILNYYTQPRWFSKKNFILKPTSVA